MWVSDPGVCWCINSVLHWIMEIHDISCHTVLGKNPFGSSKLCCWFFFNNAQTTFPVVVVKWSACSPSTLTIRVWILLKPTVCFLKNLCLKRTKINKERPGLVHLKTSFSTVTRLATLVAEFSSVRKVASEKFNKLSLYLSLIAVVVVVVLF